MTLARMFEMQDKLFKMSIDDLKNEETTTEAHLLELEANGLQWKQDRIDAQEAHETLKEIRHVLAAKIANWKDATTPDPL